MYIGCTSSENAILVSAILKISNYSGLWLLCTFHYVTFYCLWPRNWSKTAIFKDFILKTWLKCRPFWNFQTGVPSDSSAPSAMPQPNFIFFRRFYSIRLLITLHLTELPRNAQALFKLRRMNQQLVHWKVKWQSEINSQYLVKYF